MKKEIFKAYDIRGIYPTEIDENALESIGKAYVQFLSREWGGVKNKTVVVGCDVRDSSPSLKDALIRGIISQGANVIDIGTISTDMIYFATAHLKVDGGIAITASHNPAEYNGAKMVRKGAIGISSDSGLNEIADIAMDISSIEENQEKGELKSLDILDDYIRHVKSFIDFSKLETKNNKKIKILLNANFGLAGKIAKKLFSGLPVELKLVNCEPDGSFPEGPPNPMLEENRKKMKQEIIDSDVDLGIAWDADADRVFFYTSKGEAIEGYFIGSLLSKLMLRDKSKKTREKILHDPRLTWANQEAIVEAGGEPIAYKTGHMFIKAGMRKYDALFACEMSAHYYFRDNYYCDNGMIPALVIIQELINSKKTIENLISPWTAKYFTPGEINFKTEKADKIISSAKEKYKKDAKIENIDGLSMEFKDWRFNLRTSNTEPLLRLNLEARDKSLMVQKKNELTDLINSFN